MKCDYCLAPANKVDGRKIYPHRPDLFQKIFWECEPCKAYVGCHPNSERPMGRLATKELRAWKSKAHAAFDPIWKSKRMRRAEAYSWLSKKLKTKSGECHIGMFDIDMCKKVIEACKDLPCPPTPY